MRKVFGVVAIFAVAWGIGALLPVDHEGLSPLVAGIKSQGSAGGRYTESVVLGHGTPVAGSARFVGAESATRTANLPENAQTRVVEQASKTDEFQRSPELRWVEELLKADADPKLANPQGTSTARIEERRPATPSADTLGRGQVVGSDSKRKAEEVRKSEELRKAALAQKPRNAAEERRLAADRKAEEIRKTAIAEEARKLAESSKAEALHKAEAWRDAQLRGELPPPSSLGANVPPGLSAGAVNQGAVQIPPPPAAALAEQNAQRLVKPANAPSAGSKSNRSGLPAKSSRAAGGGEQGPTMQRSSQKFDRDQVFAPH